MMMLMMKIGGSWLPVVWCPHGQQCYGTDDDVDDEDWRKLVAGCVVPPRPAMLRD